jgi:hemolysin D
MPAALEIQDAPPSPLARAIVGTIILFFIAALVWSTFSWIDIVAVARGKVIPADHSKVIQPLEIGIVRRILVENGELVSQGEPVVELDPTTPQADLKRLETEWMTTKAALMRVHALRNALDSKADDPGLFFHAEESFPQDLVTVQRRLLASQYTERRAKDAVLETAILRQEAIKAAFEEERKKLDETLPLINKRAAAFKNLTTQHLVAEADYLRLEQERIEAAQTLAALQHRLAESSASIQHARSERAAAAAEFTKTLAIEQVETESRLDLLTQELVKARARHQYQTLRAPVNGRVQQLDIYSVGGVVTPAEVLMVIVPRDSLLEAEAWIQNKDIGFVREGQRAEIKVDAFPFTKYGTIPASIMKISEEAIIHEQLGWIYMARIALQKSSITVNGKHVTLMPGMALSVEIKTGTRRLIEYFLSPLLRYRDESLMER